MSATTTPLSQWQINVLSLSDYSMNGVNEENSANHYLHATGCPDTLDALEESICELIYNHASVTDLCPLFGGDRVAALPDQGPGGAWLGIEYKTIELENCPLSAVTTCYWIEDTGHGVVRRTIVEEGAVHVGVNPCM